MEEQEIAAGHKDMHGHESHFRKVHAELLGCEMLKRCLMRNQQLEDFARSAATRVRGLALDPLVRLDNHLTGYASYHYVEALSLVQLNRRSALAGYIYLNQFCIRLLRPKRDSQGSTETKCLIDLGVMNYSGECTRLRFRFYVGGWSAVFQMRPFITRYSVFKIQ